MKIRSFVGSHRRVPNPPTFRNSTKFRKSKNEHFEVGNLEPQSGPDFPEESYDLK